MQQQWSDAVERWTRVLKYAGADATKIGERRFERSYWVTISIFSLGVARYRLGDRRLWQLYVSISNEEPS